MSEGVSECVSEVNEKNQVGRRRSRGNRFMSTRDLPSRSKHNQRINLIRLCKVFQGYALTTPYCTG